MCKKETYSLIETLKQVTFFDLRYQLLTLSSSSMLNMALSIILRALRSLFSRTNLLLFDIASSTLDDNAFMRTNIWLSNSNNCVTVDATLKVASTVTQLKTVCCPFKLHHFWITRSCSTPILYENGLRRCATLSHF